MTTDTEQTPTAPTLQPPDLKVDVARYLGLLQTHVNPALTFALAWASAMAKLSAAVFDQTRSVTAVATRQMMGGWVPGLLPTQVGHERRPVADGAAPPTEDGPPTHDDQPTTDVFEEAIELLVDADLAGTIFQVTF